MGQMYNTNAAGWTPSAIADNAANTNNAHQTLKTWGTTGVARVIEVFIGGEATSSTVNRMAYRRIATNSTTPTNITPMYLGGVSNQPASNALGYVTATTAGTIANLANGHLLNLAFNAFGGVIRWVAAPGEEVYNFGTTANNSESSLASISGTGAVSTHIIFEEM